MSGWRHRYSSSSPPNLKNFRAERGVPVSTCFELAQTTSTEVRETANIPRMEQSTWPAVPPRELKLELLPVARLPW
jgi:hypothetical protein